jgi:CBS domain-containing protein
MAAMFAGASRAFMTSVVFAFETTQQPHTLLPLLGGCAAACLVSGVLMRRTIMTEKIERRGVRVPSEYSDDYLDRIHVGEICTRHISLLRAEQSVGEVVPWLLGPDPAARYGGFPVVDEQGVPVGTLPRRTLLDPNVASDDHLADLIQGPPGVITESHSLREAADHMVDCNTQMLIVVATTVPLQMVGVVTLADLLKPHRQRLRQARIGAEEGASVPRGPC